MNEETWRVSLHIKNMFIHYKNVSLVSITIINSMFIRHMMQLI